MTDKKDNSSETDQEEQNRIGDPILTAGIGSRINEAAKRVGGTRSLAEMIDISEAQLYRITSDKSQPKVETVAAVAKACGVSLEWLVTGEGSPSENRQAQNMQGISQEIIRDVVEVVEQVLAEDGRELSPDKKAELVVFLCEEIAEQEKAGEKPNRERILRLVRLAS